MRNSVDDFPGADLPASDRLWLHAQFGLTDHTQFLDPLAAAITAAERHSRPMALLCIRLAPDSAPSATHEHQGVSHALVIATERLNRCLRETDTVHYLGDYRIMVILNALDLGAGLAALGIADRIVTELSKPVRIDDDVQRLRINVGVAEFPADAETAEEFVAAAESALAHALQHERGVSVNSPSLA